jgi:hypothetical protein
MTDKEIMEALLRGETMIDSHGHEMRLKLSTGDMSCPAWERYFSRQWRIKPKPKLTWNEALQAMREGKKVRRYNWEHSYKVRMDDSGTIYGHDGFDAAVVNDAWFSEGWEVVE